MNRRGEVITYVQEKYGKDQVGQIATFHQLKARGVIRDIARAMEIPFGEADKLAKLVPEPVAGKSPPVREAIEQDARAQAALQREPAAPRAARPRGLARGPQPQRWHARRRIVISDKPLWEYVPCFRGQNDEIVTQFAMKEVREGRPRQVRLLGSRR